MLTVSEEGVIASIGAATEEPEAEEVEAAEEEEKEEMNYATKEELAEVKEMIEEIKQMIEPKEEMSEVEEEVKEEPKEELSEVKKVKHNPEGKTQNKSFLYAQKRTATTMDRVLQKISNIKN